MSRISELMEMTRPRPSAQEMPSDMLREPEHVLRLPPLLIDGGDALQEFGCLHRNILILGQGNLRTLMVCSAEQSSGTTTVALNLASFAAREEGISTLLVEANFHSPTLARYQNGSRCDGLCEMLTDQGALNNYVMPATVPGLSAISAGRLMPTSNNAWTRSRIENVVAQCRSAYSFVVFDAAPVNGSEESLHLAKYVDGVILVVKSHASAETVQRCKTALERVRARILGVVLNQQTPAASSNGTS
ncbi:MAG: CpsD/CapB family tyrosine-protein kinase [Desulfobacteraceae bacterium]|nr:CpsD/CapB family tyrosine-protein kinase [Desulfobacteraceae bacterium]